MLELHTLINTTFAAHVELFDLMIVLSHKSTKISVSLANSIVQFIVDMERNLSHALHILKLVEDEITSECICHDHKLSELTSIFQSFVVRIRLLIVELRFENIDPNVITKIDLKEFLDDNKGAIEQKMAIFDNVVELLKRIKGILEGDFTTLCFTMLTTASTQSVISETGITISPSMTTPPSTMISLSDITTAMSTASPGPSSAVLTTVMPSSPDVTSTTITTDITATTATGKLII